MPIRATVDRRAAYFSAARAEVRTGVEDGAHPPPCLVSLGRDVLGGPVSLVRAVAPEHPAGHGGHAHLADAVGDAHGGCRRMHGLDRREVGGTERARMCSASYRGVELGDLLRQYHRAVDAAHDPAGYQPSGGAIAQRLIARICSAATFTQTFGPPS
jgi:hypothetical protein